MDIEIEYSPHDCEMTGSWVGCCERLLAGKLREDGFRQHEGKPKVAIATRDASEGVDCDYCTGYM